MKWTNGKITIDEPDVKAWRDPATGIKCLILRHEQMGHLNGYVQIPHGRFRDMLMRSRRIRRGPDPFKKGKVSRQRICDHRLLRNLSVHGGLTFGGKFHRYKRHDGLWLGFDCGHAWDLQPGMSRYLKDIPGMALQNILAGGTYRDMAYVTEQVTSLASQLSKAIRSYERPSIVHRERLEVEEAAMVMAQEIIDRLQSKVPVRF